MTREERAVQIWPLLTFAASLRTTLTYKRLGQLIGAGPMALGGWLEPIQSYCLVHGLPPLTVLVVSDSNGMPGAGFVAADPASVPEAQSRVFRAGLDIRAAAEAGGARACSRRAAIEWHSRGARGRQAVSDDLEIRPEVAHRLGYYVYLYIDPRDEFLGRVAEAEVRDAYVGTSVAAQFPQGLQNPVVYVNC